MAMPTYVFEKVTYLQFSSAGWCILGILTEIVRIYEIYENVIYKYMVDYVQVV